MLMPNWVFFKNCGARPLEGGVHEEGQSRCLSPANSDLEGSFAVIVEMGVVL